MTYKPFQIVVPWPDKALSPNGSHGHWAKKARAKAVAREIAMLKTRSWIAANGPVDPDANFIRYTFYPPRNSRFDDDGLIHRMKPTRDGIADGIGKDDYYFYTCPPVIMPAEKPGRVVIELCKPF